MSHFKTNVKNFNSKIAQILKDIRNNQKITMRQLADKIDTTHSFVSKTERQERRLDIGEFTHYCIELDQDPVTVYAKIVAEMQKNQS